jgi:hypothetical protein
MTFTGGLRHFHIHTPVIGGTGLELYNLVAEYELTGDTYTETRLYDVTSGSTGSPTYQLTGQPVSSAVTVDSGTVTFDEPNDGPELAFTPTGLTATLEGAFVDHWEKIE